MLPLWVAALLLNVENLLALALLLLLLLSLASIVSLSILANPLLFVMVLLF
jgi:hypothetical protein